MTKRKEFIIDLLHFTLLAKRVQFSRSFYVANPLLYYAKLLKILTPKLSPICNVSFLSQKQFCEYFLHSLHSLNWEKVLMILV